MRDALERSHQTDTGIAIHSSVRPNQSGCGKREPLAVAQVEPARWVSACGRRPDFLEVDDLERIGADASCALGRAPPSGPCDRSLSASSRHALSGGRAAHAVRRIITVMKSPHLAALGWIIALSFAGAALLFVVALAVGFDRSVALEERYANSYALGVYAGGLVGLGVAAVLSAITLAGVRHYLNRALQLQREERAAEWTALQRRTPPPFPRHPDDAGFFQTPLG